MQLPFQNKRMRATRPPPSALRFIRQTAFALACLLWSVALLYEANAGSSDKRPDEPSRVQTPGYAGSEACSRCHQAIYHSYMRTGMGRSMSIVDPERLSAFSLPAHFANQQLDRRFDVFTREGRLYESEFALTHDGSEIFRDTRPVEWLIGAGTNGFGAVVKQDGYLFQGPLSYYTEPGEWGSSPGYEATDLGFNRPMLPGCISCHAGRANPIVDTNGKYSEPVFSELSIGCENCHGPGAAHVQAMNHPSAVEGATIVNPSRLSPYLANNICMACHQTGDVRVLKPGKTYSDIRPGQPLDSALSILIVPPTPDSPPDADHVEHYYSMTLSKCYRASGGKLSCITCHDPHVQPEPTEAPAYYRVKCLTCHSNQSCRLPLKVRMSRQPANDCTGCHMPKRDIEVISHSTATNHRIVARPDEGFPDIVFRQATSAMPALIDLDPAPDKEAAPLPDLTLLQAYGELAAQKNQYVTRYLEVLSRLEKSDPENALVQSAIGRRELKAGNFEAAVVHLQHAVSLSPSQATTCADLADALAHLDRKNEAVVWLDKSIELDPFNPFTQRTLIVRLIDLKQYARARACLEHYVEVFPQDTFMRQMLAKALAQPGQ